MKWNGIRSVFVKGALLTLLLLLAEFVLPQYVSRFGTRLATDFDHLLSGEKIPQRRIIPVDAILANEFAFQFVTLPNVPTTKPAGVLGPDQDGNFFVVDQASTDIAGHDIASLLDTMSAWYPEDTKGGIKQLIEIDGALFGLLGLARSGCNFAALVDLVRLQLVDEYPCVEEKDGRLSMNAIGGGYAVMDDNTLMIALGVANDTTWSRASAAAQDPASPYGKILRYDIIDGDGGPRLTNRSIATSGHRNPQGMARSGEILLAVEHGPKGGDEINLIEIGANYGWPLYSAGSQYNQGDLNSFAPDGAGFSNPLFTFVPSIAISDISVCPSLIAARYDQADCVIVSGLISEAIFIVLGDFTNQQVWSVEKVDVGARVREVFIHDDTLYLLPDHAVLIRADIVALPCTNSKESCGRED